MIWIELPTIFAKEKTDVEIAKDLDLGIKLNDDELCIDWCCFRVEEIIAFNVSIKMEESIIRLANGGSYRIAMPYQELKKQLVGSENK